MTRLLESKNSPGIMAVYRDVTIAMSLKMLISPSNVMRNTCDVYNDKTEKKEKESKKGKGGNSESSS